MWRMGGFVTGEIRYSRFFYRVTGARQSLGLLDNFIKALFGFGCGFRQLRHFFRFGGILSTSLIKTSKNDEEH